MKAVRICLLTTLLLPTIHCAQSPVRDALLAHGAECIYASLHDLNWQTRERCAPLLAWVPRSHIPPARRVAYIKELHERFIDCAECIDQHPDLVNALRDLVMVKTAYITLDLACSILLRVIKRTDDAIRCWRWQKKARVRLYSLASIKKKIAELSAYRDFFMKELGIVIQHRARMPRDAYGQELIIWSCKMVQLMADHPLDSASFTMVDALTAYKKFPQTYNRFLTKHGFVPYPFLNSRSLSYGAVGLLAFGALIYAIEQRHIVAQWWDYCYKALVKAQAAIEGQITGVQEALDVDQDAVAQHIQKEQQRLVDNRHKLEAERTALINAALEYLKKQNPAMTREQEQAIRAQITHDNYELLRKDFQAKTDTTAITIWNSVSNVYNVMLQAQGFKIQGVEWAYNTYDDVLRIRSAVAPTLATHKFVISSAAGIPAFVFLGVSALGGKKLYDWYALRDRYAAVRAFLGSIEMACITQQKPIMDDPIAIGRMVYTVALFSKMLKTVSSTTHKKLRNHCQHLADPSLSAEQKRQIIKIMRRTVAELK